MPPDPTRFAIDPALQRYPRMAGDLLQAWDAADALLLEHMGGLGLTTERIALLNDGFGALGCALAGLDLTSYSDSYVSSRAMALNSGGRLRPVGSLDELTGPFDLAVLRIPKNLAFFEDQLCHLSQLLAPGAAVVCAFMVKHQARGSFELLDRLIGPTRTSLAHKKARLIFAELTRSPTPSPYPQDVPLDGFAHPFVHHSNLFSREKLDIGTRFLLANLPRGDFPCVLDLGCGDGALGIAARLQSPASQVVFADESWMALCSAQASHARYFPDEPRCVWTHCYEGQAPESVDLVLCNPPFHQGHTVGEAVARQMFADAHRALRPGGRMRVVANAHLGYPSVLRRSFGRCRVVATNRKFQVLEVTR
ncbi:MAG: methyltransferase [Deltaproteobacteria bacterium]|nr:methyltransferase [Deltaproteobacteria bacterium]